MRGTEDDSAYYTRRAFEEKMKVRQAVGRGDHPAAVGAHGELALRYQLRAIAPTCPVQAADVQPRHASVIELPPAPSIPLPRPQA